MKMDEPSPYNNRTLSNTRNSSLVYPLAITSDGRIMRSDRNGNQQQLVPVASAGGTVTFYTPEELRKWRLVGIVISIIILVILIPIIVVTKSNKKQETYTVYTITFTEQPYTIDMGDIFVNQCDTRLLKNGSCPIDYEKMDWPYCKCPKCCMRYDYYYPVTSTKKRTSKKYTSEATTTISPTTIQTSTIRKE